MPENLAPGGWIVLFTMGTQGDIQPCIALARGLQAQGYAVRLVTSRNFETWIRQWGLDFAPLTADFQALLAAERELAEQGLNLRRMAQMFRQRFAQWSLRWASEALHACEGASLLLGMGNATLLAQAVAEARGLPFVRVQLQPMTPSRQLPPMVLAASGRLPGRLNLGAYQLLRLLVWYVMAPAINRHVRPQLGLRPYPWYGPYFRESGMRARVLYGFSPLVLPPPEDWPDSAKVCGYWFLDEPDWQPEPELQDFLQAGEAPVYVGFGSMVSGDPQAFTQLMLEGLRRSGRRAVLATGWGGMQAETGRIDRQLFVIRSAPHSALLPRMAAAIHHGGAGTTAAAVRAGIPSLVLPFYGDQPFWARRLQAIGVAGAPLQRQRLRPEQLATALQQVLQPSVRQAAAQLGQRIGQEQGVTVAIEQLRQWGVLARRPAGSVGAGAWRA